MSVLGREEILKRIIVGEIILLGKLVELLEKNDAPERCVNVIASLQNEYIKFYLKFDSGRDMTWKDITSDFKELYEKQKRILSSPSLLVPFSDSPSKVTAVRCLSWCSSEAPKGPLVDSGLDFLKRCRINLIKSIHHEWNCYFEGNKYSECREGYNYLGVKEMIKTFVETKFPSNYPSHDIPFLFLSVILMWTIWG